MVAPLKTTEWAALAASAAIVIIYHLIFFFSVLYNPHGSTLGVNLAARRRWINTVITVPGYDTTAMQSFRNAIVGSQYFATACSTISFLAFNSAIEDDVYAHIYYTVGGMLVLSFFNFLISIRNFTHVDFLCNIKAIDPDINRQLNRDSEFLKIFPATPKTGRRNNKNISPANSKEEKVHVELEVIPVKEELPKEIDITRLRLIRPCHKLMERATIHYTLGIRFYFLAFPVAMWVINEWAMLATTIFLITMIGLSDHSA